MACECVQQVNIQVRTAQNKQVCPSAGPQWIGEFLQIVKCINGLRMKMKLTSEISVDDGY